MRVTTEHPSDEELMALIDEELPPGVLSAVEAHVDRCERCESRLGTLRRTLARIAGLVHEHVAGDVTAARARVQQTLQGSGTAQASAPAGVSTERLRLPQWLQIAAVLLVGFGIAAMWMSPVGRKTQVRLRGAATDAATSTALPLRSVTPGAVSAHSAAELCDGVRPSRLVTDQTRRQVLDRYGMSHVPAVEYELDALITPELGGTTEVANLWPQRYDSPVWNARVKDDLERLLPEMVCRGEIDLASAQQAIASDWIAAYKRFFKTETPRVADGPPVEDDDELVLLPASYSRR